MSVKRYDFFPEYGYGEIIPDDSDGDFVKYEDYARLEQRISEQAAEIAALREQQQTRWLEDALNKCAIERDALRKQVGRMPVCVGYVGSTTAELLSDTNWGLSKEWAINVAKERTNYYDTPIYIDPPADSGEG
jgi:L-alanine-DL-glutamate epimerase-like enolase superfamily enzyme